MQYLRTMRRNKCDLLRQSLGIMRAGKPSVRQLSPTDNCRTALPQWLLPSGNMVAEPNSDDILCVASPNVPATSLGLGGKLRLAVRCLL